MIIEESIGEDVLPGVQTTTEVVETFAGTGWTPASNTLRANNGVVSTGTAGFFLFNFGVDGGGLTLTQSITNAWFERLVVDGFLRNLSNATASYTMKFTGFTLYNIYDPTTIDFATLESWVKNDTMPNDKMTPVELRAFTSSVNDNNEYSAEGGPFRISTLGDNYTSQVGTDDLTAIGMMLEVTEAVNTFASGGNAFEVEIAAGGSPRLDYIPQA